MASAPLPPSGTVTLLFTDIEGSSTLWEQHRAAFEDVLEQHHRVLREAAGHWRGFEVETAGDSFFLVFGKASDAVQFAIEAQLALAQQSWPHNLQTVLVRMGLHTGEPVIGVDAGHPTFHGPVTNRAARIGSAAHGGQVIISDATRLLAESELSGEIEFLDLGNHRLKGVGEGHLWQLLHPQLRRDFPRPGTLNPSRHNIPLPSTPFIGRAEQMAAWHQLLRQPEKRLITLTGFGGMGKTRTALELAELCADPDEGIFEDGVWWVPLENVATGDEMVQRIAEQLRLHLQPQPSVRDQLWNFHRDRRLLLVLDNVEQVEGAEAAEVVLGLLNAGPHVKCLVTSRRSLGLAAESLVELSPLPASEAETLFIERAQARKAGFTLNPQNAADISGICRSLEGIPLAIEIAASLIVLLAPRQILKRMDDQLRLLIARDPSLPRRHAALRAAIDWSFNLLTEDARTTMTQLSVFSGGFTLDAAEAVCEAFDVLEGVFELRAHSLLRAATDPNTQQERLAMLEAVRGYAAEKLTDGAARRRHAEYFLGFAEERAACLRTHDEITALCELEVDFDNLRAALTWAENNDDSLCARLALAFHEPLYYSPETTREAGHGLWTEARQCLLRGLKAAEALRDSGKPCRAALLFRLACLLDDMGDKAMARVRVEESHALFQELGDATGQASVFNFLGLLATDADCLDEAAQHLEQALQLYPAEAHFGRAKALHNQARLAARRNDMDGAWRFYAQSLDERRRAGDARGEAMTLGNMGALAHAQGDLNKARELALQSLELRRTLHEPFGIAIILNNLGDIAREEGDIKRAMTLYIHSERIFRDLRSPYADIPQAGLQQLESEYSEDQGPDTPTFAALRQEAETQAWEELFAQQSQD